MSCLREAIETHKEYIMRETLADSLERVDKPPDGEGWFHSTVTIAGEVLTISIKKVEKK